MLGLIFAKCAGIAEGTASQCRSMWRRGSWVGRWIDRGGKDHQRLRSPLGPEERKKTSAGWHHSGTFYTETDTAEFYSGNCNANYPMGEGRSLPTESYHVNLVGTNRRTRWIGTSRWEGAPCKRTSDDDEGRLSLVPQCDMLLLTTSAICPTYVSCVAPSRFDLIAAVV